MNETAIAVTGANGHIGNNLCRALINKGFIVKVLINKNDYSLKNLNLIKIKGSVTDKKSLSLLIDGADSVFHLAAIISVGANSRKNIFKVNIEGTKNVIELCRQYSVKKLIHFSSVHALQHNKELSVINENTILAGKDASIYDQSKAEAEKLVLNAANHGLNTLILNPTSVISPGDFGPSLVGQMLIKQVRNKLPFIINGGYNWVDVRDICEAAISAINKGRSGERYLLPGEWKSLKEVTTIIAEKAKCKVPGVIPTIFAKIGLPFIKLYSYLSRSEPLYTNEMISIVSQPIVELANNKAKNELGFKNRPVKSSFIDAYNWLMQNNYIE